MIRFAYDVLAIVAASIIINLIYAWWPTYAVDNTYTPPMIPTTIATRLPEKTSTQVPTTVAVRILESTPTLAPTPTLIPTPQPAKSEPIIYVFNLQPIRVWFSKDDALGYRDAILDGQPTRPFISLEKSRTIRGGRMIVLKQEDGLVMIKAEGTDIVGWIQ